MLPAVVILLLTAADSIRGNCYCSEEGTPPIMLPAVVILLLTAADSNRGNCYSSEQGMPPHHVAGCGHLVAHCC